MVLRPWTYTNTNAVSHGSFPSPWWWILTWGPPALAGHNQNLGVGKEWHINRSKQKKKRKNHISKSRQSRSLNCLNLFKFLCTHNISLPARSLCINSFSFRNLQLRTPLQIQHTQSQIHFFHPISSFFFHPLCLAAWLPSRVTWTVFLSSHPWPHFINSQGLCRRWPSSPCPVSIHVAAASARKSTISPVEDAHGL